MGLSNALFSSVSGLDTTSTAISVIGDNIANVNTPGFKEKRAEFSDVLGQSITSSAGFSQIGAGARTARIGAIFNQGTFESTGRSTDLGISGKGFFVLENASGRSYSRAGIFGFDANGVMTNAAGDRVQGYGIDQSTLQANGVLGDIRLNTAVSPPRSTGAIDLSINLDQTSTTLGAFDPADATTLANTTNFRTVLQVFDSLGVGHPATLFFTKQATTPGNGGTWQYNVALDPSSTSISNPSNNAVVVQELDSTGTLEFDTDGTLLSINGASSGSTTSPTVRFQFSGGSAPDQLVTLDFGPVAGVGTGGGTTQYDKDFAVNSFTQDGFAAGSLTSLGIDEGGFINAVFDNGETIPLARLALANFANVEGLQSVGDSALIESRASGQPLIGAAGSGNLGAIRSGALEQSNVDLANQFVRMIISQRAFQANTRTISVTNELLANLVNLGN